MARSVIDSYVAHGFLALCASVTSYGCCVLPNASGGGFLHNPPAAAFYEEPTVLEFAMVIHGAVGAGVEKRYTDEAVYYRVKGHKEYARAVVKRDVRDHANLIVRAKLPPVYARDRDALEYYFEFKLDGVKSSHRAADDPERIPLKDRR